MFQVVTLLNQVRALCVDRPSLYGSEDAGQVLAMLKFGLDAINKVLDIQRLVPQQWLPSIRLPFLERLWLRTGSAHTWIDIMKWAVLFPDSRDPPTSEESLYLGPPTGSCLDCRQPLANMPHKPTSVKYVGTNGQIMSKLKVCANRAVHTHNVRLLDVQWSVIENAGLLTRPLK
jgi:hypothetical protein